MSKSLFDPVMLGDIRLQNRVVMAPMTRSRAAEDDSATVLMAEYYSQRATAGLIITEGAQPSANGKGYCRTPGIYNDKHVAAWRPVVDGVHAKGAAIVLQIMHCGRIGHPDNKAADAINVAPSSIPTNAEVFTETGMKSVPTPVALATSEIAGVITEYVNATELAFRAGFDGVELHCTSGYLPAQFLSTGTNQRDDQYGGSLENRLRFVVETLQAMSAVQGAGKVGLRICPSNPFNDLQDDNPKDTFEGLLSAISDMGLAYVHAIHSPDPDIDVVDLVKRCFKGDLIINENYEADSANKVIASGDAQAVSFGKPFVANPDLVQRFKEGAPLADLDPNTLYSPGAEGYTSYPELGKQGSKS